MIKFLLTILTTLIILAFIGVQPLASYKDNFSVLVTEINTERNLEEFKLNLRPSGIYTATVARMEETINFNDDKLIVFNRFDGKRMYDYRFTSTSDFSKNMSADKADTIWLKNVVTDKGYFTKFSWSPKDNFVTFYVKTTLSGGKNEPLTYYK